MFHVRGIRCSLNDFVNCKTCCLKKSLQGERLKKIEIYRIGLSQELLRTDDLIADVKGKQESAPRLQNSSHFAENCGQQVSRNVHDLVEGDHARETSILKMKCQHVSDLKRYIRIESLGLFHHSRGKVESKDLCQPSVPQIAGNVTGATPNIEHIASALNLGCEATQEFPVKRLVSSSFA